MDVGSHPHILRFRAFLVPVAAVAIAACFFATGFGLALLLLTALFALLSISRPAWVDPLALYFCDEIEWVATRVLDAFLCVVFFCISMSRFVLAWRGAQRWRRPDRTVATYWKTR